MWYDCTGLDINDIFLGFSDDKKDFKRFGDSTIKVVSYYTNIQKPNSADIVTLDGSGVHVGNDEMEEKGIDKSCAVLMSNHEICEYLDKDMEKLENRSGAEWRLSHFTISHNDTNINWPGLKRHGRGDVIDFDFKEDWAVVQTNIARPYMKIENTSKDQPIDAASLTICAWNPRRFYDYDSYPVCVYYILYILFVLALLSIY